MAALPIRKPIPPPTEDGQQRRIPQGRGWVETRAREISALARRRATGQKDRQERDVSHRFASVNGVEIAYEDVGSDGRPFVLLHGLTGFRQDFHDHLPALGELGRTIVYDQRGHGDSVKTDAGTVTFAQLVGDLDALLDHLEIKECDLLGHSLGGMIALRFAIARPERVASLVLMCTSARAPDGLPRAVMAAGAEIARSEGMEKLATLLRHRDAIGATRPPASHRLEERMGSDAFWERHRRRVSGTDAEAFAALGLELLDQDPVTHRLSEIDCATLVLVGEEDAGFIEPSNELVAGIPRARLVQIPGAAHQPQLENPAAWIEAIRDHLTAARGLR
jgi:pimeloyl-ACP methyl ester carboxylesterase